MHTILKQQRSLWATILATVFVCGAASGHAAQKPAPGATEPGQEQIDAARGSFDRFLDAHPEIGGNVRIDPGLVSRPGYLREHPELQAFLDAHPLVKADPRAFISPEAWKLQNRRTETDEFLSYAVPFLLFICLLLALLWGVRSILEHRRWNRSFKVQEDVHTKLLEKFSSGQELMAYVESGAGKKLLEWAPAPFASPSRGTSSAAWRILWSLQAGLILALVGAGLLVIRDRIPDAVQPLLVFGTLGVTIGVGFILSAVISYWLSKRLGLITAGAPGDPKHDQAHSER